MNARCASIDALSGAVLSSLSARVAVLDGDGTVVRANEAWLAPERSNGIAWAPVGQNYLTVCRSSPEHESAATELARAIESVLAGEQSGMRLECSTSTPSGEHWYEVVAEPLRRPAGGAVVMLTDFTARKRAELEAQQHRAEAAHASRAATLGELAAGLAHELNQPLAAIMTNVQASRRLLTSEQPPMALVGEILDDIASDDVRAVEIIRRMRALLVKGQMDVQPLDLNELVGDVLRLVASDAILRRIRVHRRVEPDLPGITGDRVQLQQVILNLVVNGLEAMSEMPAPRRHLTIETDLREDGLVAFTVRDHGPGIAPEAAGQDLRAVLLHQVGRPRHGAVHLSVHRGGPWRPVAGSEPSLRRSGVRVRPAGGDGRPATRDPPHPGASNLCLRSFRQSSFSMTMSRSAEPWNGSSARWGTGCRRSSRHSSSSPTGVPTWPGACCSISGCRT